MKKYALIGISIIAVVILILASLTNVVGYQSVQSLHKHTINEAVNQRELLFQTILDIANNKEIQRIILKSQTSRGIFPLSDIPVITKNQLKQMYFIGLILSKFISTSKIHSIIENYRFNNQEMHKELSAVIEKDATLAREVTQILNSGCDCDNEQTSSWGFPILCSILNVLMIIPLILFVCGSSLEAYGLWLRLIGFIGYVLTLISLPIIYAIINIGTIFNCTWWFIST